MPTRNYQLNQGTMFLLSGDGETKARTQGIIMDAARAILLQYEEGLITSYAAIFKLHHLVETGELSGTVGWAFALQIAVLMRESTEGLGVDFAAKS